MDEYIEETMRYYDHNHRAYINENEGLSEKYLLSDIKRFLEGLPGKRVLDLGSGNGETSVVFRTYGYYPVCVDVSNHMVEAAREKGLEAYQADFGLLGFPNKHFSGVWANASLMHAPKYRFPLLVYEVWRLLDDKGRFYISVLEGTGEGWHVDGELALVKRYISYYQPKELQNVLERNKFRVIHESRIHYPEHEPRLLFLAEKI